MSKYDKNIPSVYSLISNLDNEEIKPVYFFFGEDHFTINNTIKLLQNKVDPLISSDFDREIINAEKKGDINEIIDLAYTYPFGSQKKLLIIKNFENLNNKKQLANYIKDTSESSVLIIANYGEISSTNSEPYKSLKAKNYIFQARELKGKDLQKWVASRAGKLGLKINSETLQILIEIVGEDKSLLEMQLQKIKTFLKERDEITHTELKNLSSATREYSIFDLLNSLGKGNAADSYKVIDNLIDNGKDLVFIINMLTKYFVVIAQSRELQQRNLSDYDAATAIGISKYYYQNCKNAQFFYDDSKLRRACKALYNIDLAVKTTSAEQKTLAIMLVQEIFSEKVDILKVV